jgi:hypothetical protein
MSRDNGVGMNGGGDARLPWSSALGVPSMRWRSRKTVTHEHEAPEAFQQATWREISAKLGSALDDYKAACAKLDAMNLLASEYHAAGANRIIELPADAVERHWQALRSDWGAV